MCLTNLADQDADKSYQHSIRRHEMSYFIYQSKKGYYSVQGSGNPVVFLQGDTASSKMFELLLPLYADNFKIIFISFLGNGKSDRVEEFPVDLWQEQAKQTIALLEHLQYGKCFFVVDLCIGYL